MHLAYFGDLSVEWPTWAAILSSVSHLFLVLNSSTNIIIYCWKVSLFNIVYLFYLSINQHFISEHLAYNLFPDMELTIHSIFIVCEEDLEVLNQDSPDAVCLFVC